MSTNQTEEQLRGQVPVEINYLLYLPEDYDPASDEKWPLMLFLHGAGERGDSLALVKMQGPPKLVDQGKDFPFILVSPQCPKGQYWSVDNLKLLLKEIEGTYEVDPDKIYLTGLSMGGYGTWALAMDMPDKFAAIAPICGGGQAHRVCAIKHVPTWVFHGAKDDVVPEEESAKMVEALEACDGDVKYTVYQDANHDSWTETYNNPELYEWFLSHERGE